MGCGHWGSEAQAFARVCLTGCCQPALQDTKHRCSAVGVHTTHSTGAMQSLVKGTRCSCGYRKSGSQKSSVRAASAGMASNRSRSGRLHVNAVASIEKTLKTVSAETISEEEIKKLMQRPRIDFTSILGTVGSCNCCCYCCWCTPQSVTGLHLGTHASMISTHQRFD